MVQTDQNFGVGLVAGALADLSVGLIPTLSAAALAIIVGEEQKWKNAGWGIVTGAAVGTILKLIIVETVK
jgi:uncharacterized membrane protein